MRELSDAPGWYSFYHALIQHTLYEDLGPTRRARAHREVAESLEDLCGDRPGIRVGELARHWFNATQVVDLNKAIDYSRQAGDAALTDLAPDDALGYYAQALGIYAQVADPDEALGIDLGIGLGTAQRQTGDPSFRDTLLAAARRAADLGDTERLVAATVANDRGTFSTVDAVDSEKIELVELALARVPIDHPDRDCSLPSCVRSSPSAAHSSDERRSQRRRWPTPKNWGRCHIRSGCEPHHHPARGAPSARLVSGPDLGRSCSCRTSRRPAAACTAAAGVASLRPVPGISRRWIAASRSNVLWSTGWISHF